MYMHPEELYFQHPELMSVEELEDFHHDLNDDVVPTFPQSPNLFNLGEVLGSPEAAMRQQFEARPPALGLTLAEINAYEQHSQHPGLTPQQHRLVFRHLRDMMLRHLIACSGCTKTAELTAILRTEHESRKPAKVPEWYKYSTVTMGPRKIGYASCSASRCFSTETVDTKFSKCAACKLAVYCGSSCQKSDWKARHKHVCKEALRSQAGTKGISQMLQNLSDLSLSGQDTGIARGGGFMIWRPGRNPTR